MQVYIKWMSRFVFLLFQVAPRPPGPFHLRGSNCYKSQDMNIFYISRIPERILFLDQLGNFLFPNWVSSLFIYVLRFLGCRVAIGEVCSSAANLTLNTSMCFATCSETHRSEPMKNPRRQCVNPNGPRDVLRSKRICEWFCEKFVFETSLSLFYLPTYVRLGCPF